MYGDYGLNSGEEGRPGCCETLPSVFCWTKMGAEAGQGLADIMHRKELERQAGSGVFAWGIGNSVENAIKYAKAEERISELDALFTPMRSRPKAADVAPSSVVMWLGYRSASGTELLGDHILVTSRGQVGGGELKRSHYALLCKTGRPLASQAGEMALDHRAVRNLVSSNPVGASQVTAVVRYEGGRAGEPVYPVVFRAKLVATAFVRLTMPVVLTRELLELYRRTCGAGNKREWIDALTELKQAARKKIVRSQLALL